MAKYQVNGRPKGAINKTTRMRNELIREKLEKSGILKDLIDLISTRFANDELKSSDAINAFKAFAPYLIQTINEETTEEQVNEILNQNDKERVASEIIADIKNLKGA